LLLLHLQLNLLLLLLLQLLMLRCKHVHHLRGRHVRPLCCVRCLDVCLVYLLAREQLALGLALAALAEP
jgi:hypothetical protein